MKTRIAVFGALTGAILGMLAYTEHVHVDPHTVSLFPSLATIAAVMLAFVVAGLLLRGHAIVFVLAASLMYEISQTIMTWERWTAPPLRSVAFSFVFGFAMMLVVGFAIVTLTASLARRRVSAI